MTPPKIFISATSGDLSSAREIASKALRTIDCHPVEQPTFQPDWRSVTDMLRGKIGDCQALIHLVGYRYGAEPDPASLPPGTPRRSYTQMEYHLAHELGLRVYTFLLEEAYPFDRSASTDTLEQTQLQSDHRSFFTQGKPHIYERISSDLDLRTRIIALQEKVISLEHEHLQLSQQMKTSRRWGSWAAAAVLFLLIGIGLGIYQLNHQFEADPEIMRANLHKQYEATAAADIAKERAGADDWRKIDEISKRLEMELSKVDDIIDTIKDGLSGKPDPVFVKASQILQEGNPNEAMAYLQSQEERVLEEASRLSAMESDIQRRRREKLRAVMLKTELQEARLAFEPALKLLEKIALQAPEWWEVQNRLGKLLSELARYPEAEKHLRRAEELAENDEELSTSLNNLASMLQATSRLEEAEPLMRRALKIHEDSKDSDIEKHVLFLSNLGSLLHEANRPLEAEPLYKRALSLLDKDDVLDPFFRAVILNNIGSLLLSNYRLEAAISPTERALRISEQAEGRNRLFVATALINLALLRQHMSQYADAEQLLRRALPIFENSYGENHPKVAATLNNLSQLYSAMNRMEEAETLLKRAVEILEKSEAQSSPYYAAVLTNFGGFYNSLNRLAEAEPLLKESIRLMEKNGREALPEYTEALSNYGFLLQSKNQLVEAEEVYRRALKIDDSSSERSHPNVARDLNNLAVVLQATNRPEEAEPLLRRALKIDEASFGDSHRNVARDLGNLATLLQASEAETLLRRALKIEESLHKGDHPDIVLRLRMLAGLLQTTNQMDEAETHLRRSLKMAEDLKSPTLGESAYALADLLRLKGNFAEAEPLIQRAVDISKNIFGENHPNMVKPLMVQGQVFQGMGRVEEAERLLRGALKIAEAGKHPQLCDAQNSLADLMRLTGRLADAELLYRSALKSHEQFYGESHPYLERHRNALLALLYSMNRNEEAIPLVHQALKIAESIYGLNHPIVAMHLNSLADLQRVTNRAGESETNWRRALKIDEAHSGSNHPDVARDLNGLAVVLYSANRLNEAEPLLRRALGILFKSARVSLQTDSLTQSCFTNYLNITLLLKISDEEVRSRLESHFVEAGLKREDWEPILIKALGIRDSPKLLQQVIDLRVRANTLWGLPEQMAEAEACMKSSNDLLQTLLKMGSNQSDPRWQAEEMMNLWFSASILIMRKDYANAEQEISKALAVADRLKDKLPTQYQQIPELIAKTRQQIPVVVSPPVVK